MIIHIFLTYHGKEGEQNITKEKMRVEKVVRPGTQITNFRIISNYKPWSVMLTHEGKADEDDRSAYSCYLSILPVNTRDVELLSYSQHCALF